MDIVKTIHVLCVFIWVGNLLALSRFMGYHVKEEANVQARLARLYRRMYLFVGVPTMIIAVTLGMVLLTNVTLKNSGGWFHMKLVFILAIIACDLVIGSRIKALNAGPETGKGVKYKILHGVLALMLIGTLVSVYIVRDKEAEIALKLRSGASNHSLGLGKNGF